MVRQSNFHHEELAYVPLPEAASRAVLDSLVQSGFEEDAIVEDYRFSSTKNLIRINKLAFAHSSQRGLDDYASITVYNAVNGSKDREIVSSLAESSAPFHVIHRDDKFSLWVSGVDIKKRTTDIQPKEIEPSIGYDQLGGVLHKYAVDFNPQRIIEVKQGREIFTHFPQVNSLQLSLWAEEIRRKPLVQCFEHTIQTLRTHPHQLSSDTITKIATQLLGLLILADTGVFGQDIRLDRPSFPILFSRAQSIFPHYFNEPFLLKRYPEAVKQAFGILSSINYAGFVPDMLGDLYAAAYDQKVRKNLGNYDTPLYLARRIWDTIPVEYLPPDERVFADITCGWGSFLITGYERLASLSDINETSLQRCLIGNDENTLFTQLAKLGLLHTTHRDDWQIDNEDAFQWDWLKENQPNIIVGNPPFSGNRKQSITDMLKDTTNKEEGDGDKRRIEKANKFLEDAIEHLKPGGYLALIMPRSFTVSEAGPSTRKKLLNECDIFELWDLPSQVFEGATVRTTVVFAQKKSTDDRGKPFNTCVRTRTIQPETLKKFRGKSLFTASSLAIDQSIWEKTIWRTKSSKTQITHIIDYPTVLTASQWNEILSYCRVLGGSIERTRGAAIGTKKKWSNYPAPKSVQWLQNVQQIMPYSYVLHYTQSKTIIYPNELERPRLDSEHLFKREKVLMQYVQTPSWGKRVKIAIERRSYYVSDNFWVIVPNNSLWPYTLTNEILAAILEWDVSNAWIIEHMKSPGIPSYAIDTVPIPTELSQDDCEALTEAVLTLERSTNIASQAVKNARSVIDFVLKAAYHLDEETFKRLRQVIEWDSKPDITVDVQPTQGKANWFTSGIVDHVNAQDGTIRLWLDGFEELQTVQIVPSMPGWMLRPNASFLTKIPREYRKQHRIDTNTFEWGMFYPQPYMYLDEKELLEGLSTHFVAKQ